ncbi:MAG: Gfo/Idh/MocA family protein [Balneolaceae bacterium]
MSSDDRDSFSGSTSRKDFLKWMGLASLPAFGWAASGSSAAKRTVYDLSAPSVAKRSYAANDHIQIGVIAAGGMGQGNALTANELPGTRIVAACDLYDSRLARCKELFGDDLFTTRSYKELLGRSDIDAVIISTTDHWHKEIAIDALQAGKAVYLEKPMVQHIEEGRPVIEAEDATGVPLIVGSQRTSSILYQKARELVQAGEIGELNFVEGYWDRRSAIGAWQYSMPPSAGPRNIDWATYRKGMPDIAFDPKHFFRWRNYSAYGTGVPGDLFVHLLSGLHIITGSLGPEKVYCTGGLRFWDDGRDAEDLVLALLDYPQTDAHPAFNVSLRVNFADGSGGGSRIRLVGSDGVIDLGWNNVTLRKWREPQRPGMSIGDFSEQTRGEYEAYYRERYPETGAQIIEPNEFVYRAPDGYNDRSDHFRNFFDAIRHGSPIEQDGRFGLRACGPALLCNQSLAQGRPVFWDAEAMAVRSVR